MKEMIIPAIGGILIGAVVRHMTKRPDFSGEHNQTDRNAFLFEGFTVDDVINVLPETYREKVRDAYDYAISHRMKENPLLPLVGRYDIGDGLELVVSQEPQDMMAKSTGHGWGSCESVDAKPHYCKHPAGVPDKDGRTGWGDDIMMNSAIAYIVKKGGNGEWITRCMIRWCRRADNGKPDAVAEGMLYSHSKYTKYRNILADEVHTLLRMNGFSDDSGRVKCTTPRGYAGYSDNVDDGGYRSYSRPDSGRQVRGRRLDPSKHNGSNYTSEIVYEVGEMGQDVDLEEIIMEFVAIHNKEKGHSYYFKEDDFKYVYFIDKDGKEVTVKLGKLINRFGDLELIKVYNILMTVGHAKRKKTIHVKPTIGDLDWKSDIDVKVGEKHFYGMAEEDGLTSIIQMEIEYGRNNPYDVDVKELYAVIDDYTRNKIPQRPLSKLVGVYDVKTPYGPFNLMISANPHHMAMKGHGFSGLGKEPENFIPPSCETVGAGWGWPGKGYEGCGWCDDIKYNNLIAVLRPGKGNKYFSDDTVWLGRTIIRWCELGPVPIGIDCVVNFPYTKYNEIGQILYEATMQVVKRNGFTGVVPEEGDCSTPYIFTGHDDMAIAVGSKDVGNSISPIVYKRRRYRYA